MTAKTPEDYLYTEEAPIIHGGDYTVVEEYKLENMPELDLWTFLDQKSDAHYLETMAETGGIYDKDERTAPVVAMTNIGDIEADVYEYIRTHRDLCQHKCYEEKGYHSEDIKPYMRLPGEVGYNHRNTSEYNWGLRGDSNEHLKELAGGREGFKKMNLDYDHALTRLLVYLPGNNCPWHFDMMEGWAVLNEHLNPHIVRGPEFIQALKDGESRYDMADKNVCDKGKVVRRLITVTPWEVGHVLMLENEYFPRYNSGDCFNMPAGIYHWSCNSGIKPKMTLLVTSFEPE